ncbi:hypothetical protein D1614_13845 [Maribellus luteus]|uniref:Uncharacterized protein n=1 Tax=Maribellus luteus TaxID=2305463 RepID=A0A399SYA1_9BACT|nr:hypothetical protein D1614_13845 [Maribellus luteus]
MIIETPDTLFNWQNKFNVQISYYSGIPSYFRPNPDKTHNSQALCFLSSPPLIREKTARHRARTKTE